MEDYKTMYEQALDNFKKIRAANKDNKELVDFIEYNYPELKENKDEEKPNGGIVSEDFNEGEGFYKVNLAYLNKEQVIEIEELVKKWNPELKEREDKIMKELILNVLLSTTPQLEEILSIYKKRREDVIAWLEKKGEKTNPYSGISFEYNGHIWGMCARDNGVDILLDSQSLKHLGMPCEQKPTWSEEDENGLGDALWAIKQARTIAKDENEMGGLWYAEKWLKSLKERIGE